MKEVKLGDIAKIITGKLDANAASENGKYPFFTCSRDILRIDKYAYDCECVLVAGNGDLNVKYYKGKFNAYQRTYIIEIKKGVEYSTIFVYWYLQLYIDTLRKNSVGSTIKYIKIGDLTGIALPLISLPEQERIVALLDKQFERIDILKNNAASQLQAAKDLFQAALKELLTPKEGWDSFLLVNEFSLKSGDLLSNKDMKEGCFPVYGGNGIAGYHEKYNIAGEQILIGRVGAQCGNIHHINENVWVTDNAFIVKNISPNWNMIFLTYMLKYLNLNQYASQTAQPVISNKSMKDVVICKPSLPEQERIAARLDAISEKVKALQSNYDQTINLCNDLKQALLKSIFE